MTLTKEQFTDLAGMLKGWFKSKDLSELMKSVIMYDIIDFYREQDPQFNAFEFRKTVKD